MNTQPDEFYIGWQDQAPNGIARHLRLSILALGLLVSLIAGLLVLNQMGFATSTFELGQLTELEGVLQLKPAPMLRQFRGRDIHGQPLFQYTLLVGKGKHGALEQLNAHAEKTGQQLDGRQTTLEGTLIYHDGRTLFELSDVKEVGIATSASTPPDDKDLGNGALMGEITDPKCLFGVMKPGFGKPHRSCAARCIAGGIPPVLKTSSGEGETRYYLLLGDQGEMITRSAMPFAGDQVFVCGRIGQVGDWFVLYKRQDKDIMLAPEKFKGDGAFSLCN